MDGSKDQPVDVETDPKQDASEERPELNFEPGEIAPHCASPFPDAELSETEERELKALVDKIGSIDVAARRWEVEDCWRNRLYKRGYQYLWPRRGGGWIYIPFATDYLQGRGGYALYGNETNIYASYGEIIVAALTRDIPGLRFEPANPYADADITAKEAATRYSRIFSRNNDLLELHEQLADYLWTDGRALLVTDHIIDAQQFGRCDPEASEPVVPETEEQQPEPAAYAVRHGETDRNKMHEERGRDEVEINEKGERQIDRAADWLKQKGIRLVVSSPVERALSSAQLLAEKLGAPLEVDDRLASLDIGADAGTDSQKGSEDIEEAFEEHPAEPIAGGESPDQFEQRVQDAVMEWLSKPGPIAFMLHDSVISQIFKMFQGDAVPPGSEVEPGWIAAITPNADGTFKPSVVFPVTPPESAVGQKRGRPRGREVTKVYGKLEHKVPFAAQSGKLEDCLWAQVSEELDVALVKAMFPEKADKIKPGGSGSGEDELDRIARINATLALEASYVTGDSMVRDCTVQGTWIRPGYFMNVDDNETRESFFEKFPDGALVIQAGNVFIKARRECMDDHLKLVHALPGSGMNRLALGSKLISIQKRLNNWIDLLDLYFTKCVPMRYVAQGPFDVNAINKQGTSPGDFLPFLLSEIPPGKGVQDLIWMEPFPTAQPIMGEFIKFFFSELPQMLSHALPSLFGSPANTDTAAGIMMQRDQALGCLGTPWHRIQMATAGYFKQAVQAAARNRPASAGAIEGSDAAGNKVRVELADLKGNVLAYPESDANFPETSIQKRSRWMELAQDVNNVLSQKLMTSIRVRHKAIEEGIQLPGLEDPDWDGYEKQMGEFELLLKMPPVPNPDYVQAKQALDDATNKIKASQMAGTPAAPPDLQTIQQMEQQLQSIPPLISSVPVKETDKHEAEAEACLDKINSADGRKLADGNQEEKEAFANLTLHYFEHKAKIEPKPTMAGLPKGISLNLKDAPPDAMANALKDTGLETSGQDVVQTREFNAEIRKSSKVGGPPVPGVEAAQPRPPAPGMAQ